MTNDDLLAELGADWRRQTVDPERVRRLTERKRRQIRLSLLGKLAAAAIALGFGLFFVWQALAGGPARYGISGVVLLIGVPLILLDYAGTRRRLAIDHGDSPAGALSHAKRDAALARHLLWGCRAAALLLGLSAFGLAGLWLAGLAGRVELLLIVPLWGGTALAVWLWQAWRCRRDRPLRRPARGAGRGGRRVVVSRSSAHRRGEFPATPGQPVVRDRRKPVLQRAVSTSRRR